jgi:hypothetical protein
MARDGEPVASTVVASKLVTVQHSLKRSEDTVRSTGCGSYCCWCCYAAGCGLWVGGATLPHVEATRTTVKMNQG